MGAPTEGNAFRESVSEIVAGERWRRRRVAAARPHRVCMDCEEYRVCRSGCGVNFQTWDPVRDEDCPGYKRFITYMRQRHRDGLRPRDAGYRSKIAL